MLLRKRYRKLKFVDPEKRAEAITALKKLVSDERDIMNLECDIIAEKRARSESSSVGDLVEFEDSDEETDGDEVDMYLQHPVPKPGK
jgi:hypothetical protein